MNQKNTNRLMLPLMILSIAFAALLLFSFKAYENTAKKLDEVLAFHAEENTEIPETTAQDESIIFLVNGEPLKIELANVAAVYNVKTLNTEFETHITAPDSNHSILVNETPMVDGVCSIKLDEISKASRITLTIDGNYYYINTLPNDFPSFQAIGKSSTDGFYYTTLDKYLAKFDASGNLVFYRDGNAANAGPFRRNEIDGEIIYSYLELRSSLHHEPMKDVYYYPSVLVLLNEQYEKIKEVTYMLPTDSVPEKMLPENHDHIVLGKDHYVLVAYVARKAANIPEHVEGSEFGSNVAACIFQEIKDGEVIFEWDSTEHPELYELSLEACDYTNQTHVWADYAHLNALSIDPRDNNFICSLRNLDAILKINRETGDILWIFGGKGDEFGITEEQQFHRQHNITVTDDGYYLMFDNGCHVNVLGYPKQTSEEKAALDAISVSRILKFKLDEENMKILDFEEFTVEGFYSASMGSAQVIDNESDTILIGWGGKSRAGMPFFQEINFQTKTVNFEMLCNDPNMNCYRVALYNK